MTEQLVTFQVTLGEHDRVLVTPHALERYIQRVRPGLDVQEAVKDMRRLLLAHARWGDAPAWMLLDDRAARRYLLVGDDLVFPVTQHGFVLTTIARGEYTTTTKERRREARRFRSHVRKAIRRDGGKVTERKSGRGRPLREIQDDDVEAVA